MISKALEIEKSSTKVRSPSSTYWPIFDSSDEPGRRTPPDIFAVSNSCPWYLSHQGIQQGGQGVTLVGPTAYLKKEVTKPECRQAEEISE